MATSKNSKKGSKPTVVVKEKRVKPKKEYILIELTQEVYKDYKSDLSTYKDKQVEDVIKRYGKTYLRVKN